MKRKFCVSNILYVIPFLLLLCFLGACDNEEEPEIKADYHGTYEGKSATYFELYKEENDALVAISDVKVKVNSEGIFFDNFPIGDIIYIRNYPVNYPDVVLNFPKEVGYKVAYEEREDNKLKLTAEPLIVNFKDDKEEKHELTFRFKTEEDVQYIEYVENGESRLYLVLEISSVLLDGITSEIGYPIYISFDLLK